MYFEGRGIGRIKLLTIEMGRTVGGSYGFKKIGISLGMMWDLNYLFLGY